MDSEQFVEENPTVSRKWVERFCREHSVDMDAEADIKAFEVSAGRYDSEKVVGWMGY